MPTAARSKNGAIAVLLVLLVREAPPQNRHRDMRIGASPQTEHHPLLIALPCVVSEGDVELALDFRVLQPVPFRKAKEWLVARVVAQGMGECVTRREVDAKTEKPLVELGFVGGAERVQIHLSRVGTPVEKQVQEVWAAQPQYLVERRLRLCVHVIPVGDEEKHERVILALDRNLQSRAETA